MSVPQDVTLVCLLRLDTTKLPKHTGLAELPEHLSSVVADMLPTGLTLDKYYAVLDYAAVRSAVNSLAEPFDELVKNDVSSEPGVVLPLFGGRRDTLLN